MTKPDQPAPRRRSRAALRARADWIGRQLDALYPNPGIPLQHRDAYTLLIAVLLSAQCTDKRVNLITPALFAAASTPQEMVTLGQKKIRRLIATCGLGETKSRSICELSKKLIHEYGGAVPASLDALETLPGVGHKTASVVMAQAFGEAAFPVDTHIHRLARRWGLSSGKNVRQTEADLKALFPPERWNRLHLQMILYGREHCTARGCDGTRCPLCRELCNSKKIE